MTHFNPQLFSLHSCSRLVSLIAAGAIAALAVGCGDDAGVAGPSVLDDDAAANGQDGLLSGSDGASLDQDAVALDVTILGSDGVSTGGDDATVVNPTASCAGKCGVYDKKAACQCDDKCTGNGDCCADYKAQCGTVANTCGDGKCVAPEDKTTCPGDCGTVAAPFACKGNCGTYDKNNACQCDSKCTSNGDCCGDYKAECGAVANTCGDGKCAAPETQANCPADCGAVTPAGSCTGKCGAAYDKNASCQCDGQCTQNKDCCGDYATACNGTTSPIVSCIETSCPTEVATCLADAACAKVIDCAKTCTTQNCLFGCVQGGGGGGFNMPAGLQGLYTCGNNAKCFSGTPPTTPVCGNGTCEAGETAQNCAKDCGTTTPPVCGNGTCEAGETAQNCAKDCTNAGGANSCVGKCGQLNTSGGFNACQCQTWCTQAGNCCSDYQAVCGTTTTPACGDGKCDAGETAASCPADCGGGGTTTTPDQCVQAKCATQYASCAKDPACLTGLACIEGGKQIWNCVTDWQVGMTLGQVQGCAAQNKCF